MVIEPLELLTILVNKPFNSDWKKEEIVKCRFSASIKLILADYLVENKSKSNATERCNKLKELQVFITNIESKKADKIYESVYGEFNGENKQFYINELPSLRKEIIDVMTEYKNAKKKLILEKQELDQVSIRPW